MNTHENHSKLITYWHKYKKTEARHGKEKGKETKRRRYEQKQMQGETRGWKLSLEDDSFTE